MIVFCKLLKSTVRFFYLSIYVFIYSWKNQFIYVAGDSSLFDKLGSNVSGLVKGHTGSAERMRTEWVIQ